MPWENTPAKRRRDAQVYGPEYRRNRAVVLQQAAGRCSQCGHPHPLQTDHVIPVTQGGTHAVSNLTALCAGEGTCRCHERKTAGEGGGFRQPADARDPDPRPKTRW